MHPKRAQEIRAAIYATVGHSGDGGATPEEDAAIRAFWKAMPDGRACYMDALYCMSKGEHIGVPPVKLVYHGPGSFGIESTRAEQHPLDGRRFTTDDAAVAAIFDHAVKAYEART